MMVPRAIERIVAKHPGLVIDVDILKLEEAMDYLLLEKGEIVAMSYKVDHPSLDFIRLARGKLLCITPPDHPLAERESVSAEDIARYPLIGIDPNDPYGRIMADIFERRGLTYTMPIRARFGTTVCRLVQAGLGIAVIDQFTVAHDAVPGIRLARHRRADRLRHLCRRQGGAGPVELCRKLHRAVEGGDDGGGGASELTSCSFERISWYLTLTAQAAHSPLNRTTCSINDTAPQEADSEWRKRHENTLTSQLLAGLLVPGMLLLAGAANAADIQKRTLKFPSASNKGHPQVLGVQKFADLVAEKSGGKITVKPFPGGVLGADLQTVSAMQGGTVDLTVMNASLLAGNVKEMAVLDFPYMFNTAEEADAVLDGPVGRKLLDKLPEKGLVGLAYWDLGFREMHTNKRPITKAEDLQGLKMRVIPTPIYVEFMNAVGANAVPMPFTETYTALETGAVDGMTNPLLNIMDGKFNEVSKYLSLTNHMYTPQAVIASKKLWDKLSEDERKILQEAAAEATVYQRQVAREQAAKALDEIAKSGMKINELPPEEIAKLREKAGPVIEKFRKEIGEELVTELYAEIDKVRKN